MVLKKILSKSARSQIDQKSLQKSLEFIDDFWAKLECHNTEDTDTLVGLPYPYIMPAFDPTASFRFEEQYYWDSYFIALGLKGPKYQILVEGMLENLLYLYRRFGMVPTASRMYFTSRSQPPVLTSFIFHVYDTYGKDKDWLKSRIELAKQEYRTVWMSTKHPKWHNVYEGLSRYYDINVLHDLAEAESGWDMTPRFDRKCLDFLPIDLNSLLYKYETDFARADEILGDENSAKEWIKASEKRKESINKLMWGKFRGFYFDYNYQRKVLGDIWSLAAYYTMWAGLASEAQAKKLVDNLVKFEKQGGLMTTARPLIDTNGVFGSLKAQWANPNGWAPLQYITVEGLRRYGYEEEAKRIATAWVKNNLNWFNRHGEFIEKYNVANVKRPPLEGVYPSQKGFGWSNAIYVHFVEEFKLHG